MSERSKILEIKDYFKKPSAIDKYVSEIGKDEFTVFRINKDKEKINKLYLQGRYHIDDDNDEIG